MKGIITKYNTKRGFGFIRCDTHGDVFVHIKKVRNSASLRSGQEVCFDIEHTPKGIAAINVVAGTRRRSPYFGFCLIAGILLAGGVLLLLQHLPLIYAYITAINTVTLVIYAYDKWSAGTSRLRCPEWFLHGLAFFGGSPGALIAQRLFRHKTRKLKFQLIYWSLVIVQAASAGYWLYDR